MNAVHKPQDQIRHLFTVLESQLSEHRKLPKQWQNEANQARIELRKLQREVSNYEKRIHEHSSPTSKMPTGKSATGYQGEIKTLCLTMEKMKTREKHWLRYLEAVQADVKESNRGILAAEKLLEQGKSLLLSDLARYTVDEMGVYTIEVPISRGRVLPVRGHSLEILVIAALLAFWFATQRELLPGKYLLKFLSSQHPAQAVAEALMALASCGGNVMAEKLRKVLRESPELANLARLVEEELKAL